MVCGGQFGELRRRGSLIDDEEQLVRLVFTAARVVVIVVIAPRALLFCQPSTTTYFTQENGISQCVLIYNINHDYNYGTYFRPRAIVTIIKFHVKSFNLQVRDNSAKYRVKREYVSSFSKYSKCLHYQNRLFSDL